METEETPLLDWLVANMGLGVQKSEIVSKKLEDLWITSVESLQTVLSENQELLDQIGLPKPIQGVFKVKLSSFKRKKVEDLLESEVMQLVDYSFPTETYGSTYLENKINGFVLNSAANSTKLAEWGITSEIHADAFWARLATWTQFGVPLKLLAEAAQAHVLRPAPSVTNGSLKSLIGQKRVASSAGSVGSDAPSQRSIRSSDTTSKRSSSSSGGGNGSSTSNNLSDTSSNQSITRGRGRPRKTETSSGGAKINRELANLLRQTNPEPKRSRKSSVPPPPPPSSRSSEKGRSAATALPPTPVPAPAPAPVARSTASNSTNRSSEKKKKREYESSAEEDEGAENLSINGKIKSNLAKLCLKDKDAQANALKLLSKLAAEHPALVACMRNVGVLDKMLEIVANSRRYDEYVVWRSLVALNNIIARAKGIHVRFLVEKGLIRLVLPMVHSDSGRLRIQGLWILGNLGTTETAEGFKSTVLTPSLVAAIVESYSTIHQLTKYAGPDNVRQRYAETINQLSCQRSQQQFRILAPFVAVLRDIIRVEENVEAVVDACYAIDHLLDATDPSTVDCMIDEDIIPVLVHRLDDAKISVANEALVTLSVLAECCTSSQVLEMEPVLRHLERFIVGSASSRPNKKLLAQAVICVSRICEGGDQSLQQITDHAPHLLPALMNLVQTDARGQPSVHTTSESAALALAHAMQGANHEQLGYFVELKMYAFAFQMLDIFSENLLIVEESLKALTAMVHKLENIRRIQDRAELRDDFDVAEGWGFVLRWTRGPGKVVSAEERKDLLEIAGYARGLLEIAKQLELVPEVIQRQLT